MIRKIELVIITIFVIALIENVGAVGFSPSYLTFNLEKNEQGCKTIRLVSNSEKIIVSDKWAENSDIEWKVSLFNSSTNEHKLNITYPKELSLSQRDVEVCLSAQEDGNYRGVILLTEQQVGNSIVQVGIWIKATIGNAPITQIQTANPEPTITTTTNSQIQTTTTQNQTQIENETQETTDEQTKTGTNPITGAVIGGGNVRYWVFGFIGLIIVIAGFVGYKNWRRKRWEQGY